MSTYRQIILDYLEPKYHSLVFENCIYDFLNQPISQNLTQIILKDYFKHQQSVSYVYYDQHPSILVIAALRAQPNKEYMSNVPKLSPLVFKTAHQFLMSIKCIRTKASQIFSDQYLQQYFSKDIYTFLKETNEYLNTVNYGAYVLHVLSCQGYINFSKLKLVPPSNTLKLSSNKAVTKLNLIKLNASKRGLECTLTLQDVEKLLSVKRCYYTGIRFTDKKPRTFDRVDNSKGYIPGNVVACIEQINLMKASYIEALNTTKTQIALTPKQMLRMASLLVKRLDS